MVSSQWAVVRGSVWTLGHHLLLCIKCTKDRLCTHMVRLHPLPFCCMGKGQKVILRFIRRRTVSCIQKCHGALTILACMDGLHFLFFFCWGGKIFLWCPLMVTFHSQWSASLTDKDTNKLLQLQPWESSYLGIQILILHPAGSVFVKDAFTCCFL